MLNQTALPMYLFSFITGSLVAAWFRGYLSYSDLLVLWKLLLILLLVTLILIMVGKKTSAKKNGMGKSSRQTYLMMACVSLVCFGVGCVFSSMWILPSDEEQFYAAYGDEGLVRLHKLKSIRPDTIVEIRIFDEDGERLIKAVTEKKLIGEFAEACKDVTIYLPNHPTYTHSWYVIIRIQTEKQSELKCHFELDRPNNLDGDLIVKTVDTETCYGSFTSLKLRDWFEKHIKR